MFGFRPMWNVPQAFNWAWYRKDEYGKPGVDMPTEDELRSMTWQSVAGGANGLVYYSFFNIFDGEKEPLRGQIFSYVCKVAQEVRDREAILLSPRLPPEIRHVPEGMAARAWRTEAGETWLLVCNATRQARTGRVEVDGCAALDLALKPIEVVFRRIGE